MQRSVRHGTPQHRTILLLIALLLATFSTSSPLRAQDNCDLDDFQAFMDRGNDHYDDDEYELAVEDYTCALTFEPESTSALNSRGNSYSNLDQYEEAIADYTQALEFEAGSKDYLYYNIALTYYFQDDMTNADQYLEMAFEEDPESPGNYLLRGNFAYDRGDYDAALADLTEAIERNYYEIWFPYYNRAITYYELGDYDAAMADYDSAIQANPDYEPSYLARANTLQLIAPEDAPPDYLQWIELIEEVTDNDSVSIPVEDRSLPMKQGRVYRYDFEGSAGQNLSAAARVVDDSELDPLLVLLDPDGHPIEADDDSGVNLDAVIPTFTLPDTGLYTLVISHAGGGSEGTMALSLQLDGEATREFSIYELRVDAPVVVYTTEGDNLNLRSGPGISFDIIAKLEKDSTATLLEGPRKADGYAWWLIRTPDGQEGWAVERADEEQTLQPPLVIGSQATVYPLSGDRLNVREGAGRSFAIVTQLEQGEQVTLLDGPVETDDFRWWQIRTSDGTEGWAVDEADGEQTIIGLAAIPEPE